MAYIKLKLRRISDIQGNTLYSQIGRVESDMADTNIYELPILTHALTYVNDIRMSMDLDIGSLDRDWLGGSEFMMLDSGKLEIDYLYE
jgi:hypothetical protein